MRDPDRASPLSERGAPPAKPFIGVRVHGTRSQGVSEQEEYLCRLVHLVVRRPRADENTSAAAQDADWGTREVDAGVRSLSRTPQRPILPHVNHMYGLPKFRKQKLTPIHFPSSGRRYWWQLTIDTGSVSIVSHLKVIFLPSEAEIAILRWD